MKLSAKLKLSAIFVCFFIVFTSNQSLGSTTDSLAVVKKNSISFNLSGTSPGLGFSYDRIFNNKMIGEVGAGLMGIGVGLTYYPLQINRLKPCFFIGVKPYYRLFFDIASIPAVYFPIGVTRFFDSKVNLGASIGPVLDKRTLINFSTGEVSYRYWGAQINVKVGYRF